MPATNSSRRLFRARGKISKRLRREKSDGQARQLALIKVFVTSVAVVEMAVDVRGPELRCGLSNMRGTPRASTANDALLERDFSGYKQAW